MLSPVPHNDSSGAELNPCQSDQRQDNPDNPVKLEPDNRFFFNLFIDRNSTADEKGLFIAYGCGGYGRKGSQPETVAVLEVSNKTK